MSEALQVNTAMTVVLPERQLNAPDGRFKTMLLLHGLTGNHTDWTRQTSIERYANFYQYAVVMPSAGNSFYSDMVNGPRYWQHIAIEVPQLARRWFGLSDQREHNVVAGLSMGGYGAFKVAMSFPQNYAAAASLSGVLDMAHRTPEEGSDDLRPFVCACFGDPPAIADTDADLVHLARRLVQGGAPRPRMYACCGSADRLYANNLRFRQHAQDLGLDIDWELHPGRYHDWSYWDQQIVRVFDWLRR